MEKVDISKFLKDCPTGMELDCTMLDNVVFEKLDFSSSHHPIIIRRTNPNTTIHLTKYGQYSDEEDYKCIIFPKGKTNWEGFVPPCKFKDGDIVYIKTIGRNHNEFIIIFKEIKNGHIHKHLCYAYQVLHTSPNAVCHLVDIEEIRIATEEEKQKLFDAIKANGYKWNAETKTLEKLVVPQFKVGDRIRHKTTNKDDVYEISKVYDDSYGLVGFTWMIYMKYQDQYELVPNKFDITTLKPFDNCKYSLDKGKTWKFAQYWYIQNNYNVTDIEIELWQD